MSPFYRLCLFVQGNKLEVCLKKDDKSQCGTGCHMKKWIYKLNVQQSKFFSISPYSFILMWWHINCSRSFGLNKFLATSFGWVDLNYYLRDLGLSHQEFFLFVGLVSYGEVQIANKLQDPCAFVCMSVSHTVVELASTQSIWDHMMHYGEILWKQSIDFVMNTGGLTHNRYYTSQG